jgi:hypothetical protein
MEQVMLNKKSNFIKAVLPVVFACALYSSAQNKPVTHKDPKPALGRAPAILWREPTDIKSRNLIYGQGGPDHQPMGKLSYIKEKLNGVNPKFDVRDEADIRWGVKMGNEAKPETAATRWIWAVGYFTNEDYYLPELKVGGNLPVTRGQNLIQDGKIQGVRLKRHNKGERQIADWSWDKNPFAGTKELDGLKVMMELICNTDLKTVQQHVYDVDGIEQRYIAADVGASFGKAGKGFLRTKGKLKDYVSLPLIKSAGPDYVDFWHFKQIPVEHVKWIGGYLAQLSDEQIKDAFRAGGFSTEEVEGFAANVRQKINELVNLGPPKEARAQVK